LRRGGAVVALSAKSLEVLVALTEMSLARNRGDRITGDTVATVTHLATEFLNLAAEGDLLRAAARVRPADYASCFPDPVSEERLRQLTFRFHNLQSLYDTHVAGTSIESFDAELPILRGHASVIYHLLEMATDLAHYYERYASPHTADAVLRTLSALMPENAIIVDESISAGRSFFPVSMGTQAHDYLQLTGGSIGSGLPMATGAAIACPGRTVINMEGDGSSMYTIQALWTQAREKLNVVTVIFANRGYQILKGELVSVGAASWGERAERMLSIVDPDISWVKLAEGMGVEARAASTCEELAKLLRHAVSRPGPFLIEAQIGR